MHFPSVYNIPPLILSFIPATWFSNCIIILWLNNDTKILSICIQIERLIEKWHKKSRFPFGEICILSNYLKYKIPLTKTNHNIFPNILHLFHFITIIILLQGNYCKKRLFPYNQQHSQYRKLEHSISRSYIIFLSYHWTSNFWFFQFSTGPAPSILSFLIAFIYSKTTLSATLLCLGALEKAAPIQSTGAA